MNVKKDLMKIWEEVKNITPLIFLRFKLIFKKVIEFIYDFLNFYLYNPPFFKADLYLKWQYLFQNPFSLSQSFWERREAVCQKEQEGEPPSYLFGEIPFSTLSKILDVVDLRKRDSFIDMGMGRGEALLFLRYFTDATLYGVELVPEFIEKFEKTIDTFSLKNIEVFQHDFLNFSFDKFVFEKPPVVYLFGSALREEQIERFIENCNRLPEGSRIITVSFSLKEYRGSERYHLSHKFEGSFPWGSTDIYIQTLY